MRNDDAMPKSKRKSWSYSAGEKGRNRVRGFERPGRPGDFLLQYSEPDAISGRSRPRRLAIDVSDCADPLAQRAKVKQRVDELAARIASTPGALPERVAAFGTLVERYLREVTPAKSLVAQRHDSLALRLAVRAFGSARNPMTLDRSDWDAFIRRRTAGQLPSAEKKRPAGCHAVGPNTIAHDLRTISAMLSWATMLRTSRGEPVLTRHPFRGFPFPREISPCRPRITDAEFAAVLGVADRVHTQCRLALVLADQTGHRVSAIRCLEWRDVDLAARTITWRAATDKARREHTTPLSEAATIALAAERTRRAGIGNAPIFESRWRPGRPLGAKAFEVWWNTCEELAELEPAKRRGWHALRRRFADQLRGVPLKDLAALGGWLTTRMPVEVYQSSDVEAQRAALAQRRSVAER
jgi:integrase